MLHPETTSIKLPDGTVFETPLRHLDGCLAYSLAHWNSWALPKSDVGLEYAPAVIAHQAATMVRANMRENSRRFTLPSGPSIFLVTQDEQARIMRCITPSWISDTFGLERIDERLQIAGVEQPLRWEAIEMIRETRAHALFVNDASGTFG